MDNISLDDALLLAQILPQVGRETMSVYPIVLAELLQYRQCPFKDTEMFQNWKHNQDLCPMMERQLNHVRDSFLKHQSVAYDIQGPRDQGADVVMRYSSGGLESSSQRVIIFQVKSFHDIEKGDYLKELRSQHFQAENAYGTSIDHYHIVLCTDIKVHRDAIRNIKNEFAKRERVTVIDPAYALTFLRLIPLRIDFVIESILKEEDRVLKKARELVRGFTPTQVGLVLATLKCGLDRFTAEVDLDSIRKESFLHRLYGSVPDYEDFDYVEELVGKAPLKKPRGKVLRRSFEERFSADLDLLADQLFSMEAGKEVLKIQPAYFDAIQAIMLDAKVRYNYKGNEMLMFTLGALGVMDRYGLESPADSG